MVIVTEIVYYLSRTTIVISPDTIFVKHDNVGATIKTLSSFPLPLIIHLEQEHLSLLEFAFPLPVIENKTKTIR